MPSPEPAALLTFDSMEKCASYLYVMGKQLQVEQCSISTLSIHYARQRGIENKNKEIGYRPGEDADEKKRRHAAEKKQRQRERQKETQKLCSNQEAAAEEKRKVAERKRRSRENKKKAEEIASQEGAAEEKRKVAEKKRTSREKQKKAEEDIKIEDKRREQERERKRKQCANMSVDKRHEVNMKAKKRKRYNMLQKIIHKFYLDQAKESNTQQIVKESMASCTSVTTTEIDETEQNILANEVCDQTKKNKEAKSLGKQLKEKNNTIVFCTRMANEVPSLDTSSDKDEGIQEKRLKNAKKKQEVIYLKNIKEKPIFICTCCHRMFYKKSTVLFKSERYKWGFLVVQKALANVVQKISSDSNEYICKTCDKHLRRKEPTMPAQAEVNIGKLDAIPPVLQDINDLK